MQLQLFHPMSYDGLPIKDSQFVIVDRRADPTFQYSYERYPHLGPLYCWECRRCGQHGMMTSWRRQDTLEWAIKNHKCKQVEEDYVVDHA